MNFLLVIIDVKKQGVHTKPCTAKFKAQFFLRFAIFAETVYYNVMTNNHSTVVASPRSAACFRIAAGCAGLSSC